MNQILCQCYIATWPKQQSAGWGIPPYPFCLCLITLREVFLGRGSRNPTIPCSLNRSSMKTKGENLKETACFLTSSVQVPVFSSRISLCYCIGGFWKCHLKCTDQFWSILSWFREPVIFHGTNRETLWWIDLFISYENVKYIHLVLQCKPYGIYILHWAVRLVCNGRLPIPPSRIPG